MIRREMRKSLFVLVLFVLCIHLFGVDTELVTRYLTATNEQYSAGNYVKAFSYVNTVLSNYSDENIPYNVEVLAETVYYAYLEQIKENRDSASFSRVKEKLIAYPYISSERISRIIKVINTHEAQDMAWGADPQRAPPPAATSSSVSSGNPVARSTLELQLALESVRLQAEKEAEERTLKTQDEFRKELLETQKSAYERALTQSKEVSGSSGKLLVLAIIILAALSFIIFIAVIINLIVNVKNTKSQNEKFVETLRAVSQVNRTQIGSSPLQSLPPVFGVEQGMRLIGSAMKETGLPPPPMTEQEKKELADLALKCREVGLQIDQITGRKNNSKNVAEMVFKLAQEMGVAQYESTLFFSVGMVYDIGFLEIDPALLKAENLTEAQKFEIRNHVKQGLAQLSFVPEKYMSVFVDGVLMHHENMDGSGYPEGLQESRIPFIARLIHVAESFNALVSRRSYRDIYDKETALEELKKKPGLYDHEIVLALERLI